MSDYGELRAWLAMGEHDGESLHAMLSSWPDMEELTREVLPYLSDQLPRLDVRVEPYQGVPYSAWFDVLLEGAMRLDSCGDFEGAKRGYALCLRLKPDCVPACVNLFRITHRGAPVAGMLSTQRWEAHGPYGDESWENIQRALSVLQGQSDEGFMQALDDLWGDVEHQSTLYPSTIAVAFFLIFLLDSGELSRAQCRASCDWLTTVVAWIVEPLYESFYETPGDEVEKARWLGDLWSFLDMKFTPGQTYETEALWWVHHRQNGVWEHDETWQGYEDYECCKLPMFEHEAFLRHGQNVIYDGIFGALYQVIASGIPVYARVQQVHEDVCNSLWMYLGHMAHDMRPDAGHDEGV